jgi:WD40 repeat protein
LRGIGDIAWSPDGKLLAWGGSKGSERTGDDVVRPFIVLWDVSTGIELRRFGGGFAAFAFSPDSKTLAAGNFGDTILLYDVATGKERGRLRGEGKDHFYVDVRYNASARAFSPCGRTLAAVTYSAGQLRLWDVATGKLLPQFGGHRPGSD